MATVWDVSTVGVSQFMYVDGPIFWKANMYWWVHFWEWYTENHWQTMKVRLSVSIHIILYCSDRWGYFQLSCKNVYNYDLMSLSIEVHTILARDWQLTAVILYLTFLQMLCPQMSDIKNSSEASILGLIQSMVWVNSSFEYGSIHFHDLRQYMKGHPHLNFNFHFVG